MSVASKLMDLFVEFSTRNEDKLNAVLDAIKEKGVQTQQSIGAASLVAAAGVGYLTARFQGLFQAGIGASNMGQILNFQMGVLSRTIAGIFGPEILKVIDYIQRFTAWLQSLSDQQKLSIANFVKGAAAALLVVTVMPKVISAIQGLIASLLQLGAAEAVASGGLSLIIPALAAIAAFFAGTKTGQDMFGGIMNQLRPFVDMALSLAPVFESIFGSITSVLKPIVSMLVTIAKLLMPIIELTLKWTGAMISLAGFVVNVSMIPFRLLLVLLQTINGIFSSITSKTGGLCSALGVLVDAVSSLFSELTEAFGELFEALGELAAAIGKDLLKELIVALSDVIVPAIKFVAREIKDIAAAIKGAMILLGLNRPTRAGEAGDHSTLAPPVGGPENIENVFARLQAAALKSVTGQTLEEKAAQVVIDNMPNITPALIGIQVAIAGLNKFNL